MNNYIWEKSFKRTWMSTHYDKFNQGILEVANYIRLSGGETRDIWYGFTGDFTEKDSTLLTQDEYVLPYIYFSFQGVPNLKYEKEAEVVEKVIKEKGITVQNYLDWIDVGDAREKAEEEYKKSFVLNEWQKWEKANEDFFKKLGDLTSQFNSEYRKDGDFIYWKMTVWEWNKENGILCFSPITNRMDLHDPAVIVGLTKEKREELHKMSLEIFKDFGGFLKNKFLNEK